MKTDIGSLAILSIGGVGLLAMALGCCAVSVAFLGGNPPLWSVLACPIGWAAWDLTERVAP